MPMWLTKILIKFSLKRADIPAQMETLSPVVSKLIADVCAERDRLHDDMTSIVKLAIGAEPGALEAIRAIAQEATTAVWRTR